MGSLQRGLFGGSKQTSSSSSENKAFDFLRDSLGGVTNQAGGASGQLANLLGLNGPQAQNAGFDGFRGSTGYNFGFGEGQRALTGSAASKGILNSGSAAKALTQYGQDYASTKYNDYTSLLSNLLGQGLQAGNVISGAGQVSQQQSKGSTSNGGFGGVVGKLLGK